MRIVTRPDLDGVFCAALLSIVEQITAPIEWVAPSDMQEGVVVIRDGDIISQPPL
jgi:hypothetical protein